jgi:antitoxin component YwqK of YwqJK toxin-antitoxin module
MKAYTTILATLFSSVVIAQNNDIPFLGYFGGYGIKQILKAHSIGNLFVPNADTNVIIYLAKNLSIYRLYDSKNRLRSEGSVGGRVFVDYFKRFGKWTAYYPETGKPKVEGYFYYDEPIGTWCYYFGNGQLEKQFSIARMEYDSFYFSCRVGLYEEYFETGGVKVTGFYKVIIDSVRQARYDTNLNRFVDVLVRGPVSKPDGLWMFYKQSGELERKEEHY